MHLANAIPMSKFNDFSLRNSMILQWVFFFNKFQELWMKFNEFPWFWNNFEFPLFFPSDENPAVAFTIPSTIFPYSQLGRYLGEVCLRGRHGGKVDVEQIQLIQNLETPKNIYDFTVLLYGFGDSNGEIDNSFTK